MSTIKISELPAITGANAATTDVLPLVDVSLNTTNKITRDEFFKNTPNIGIGVSTSTAALTVGGVAGGDRTVQIGSAGATRGVFTTDGTNALLNIGCTNDSTTGRIAFRTGSALTERMRIDELGNVGINTNNPSTTLQVNGTVTATAFAGPLTGAVTGNASTATTLQTARNIGGVSFNGSADINLPGVNAAGNQNTTGSAATLTTTRTLWGQNFNGGANVTGSLTGVGDITGAAAVSLLTTTTGALTLDSGTTGAINLGTNANAKTVTVGNATGATSVVVNSGTGHILLNGANTNRVGINTTAPLTPLHVAGETITTGIQYFNQPAQTSKSAAATLTIAELKTGIIQYTGAAANLTLPTGTDIESGVPASLPVNQAFDFSVINTGTGIATIVTNTGLTLVGTMTVAVGASARLHVRKTATNTYTIYRVS